MTLVCSRVSACVCVIYHCYGCHLVHCSFLLHVFIYETQNKSSICTVYTYVSLNSVIKVRSDFHNILFIQIGVDRTIWADIWKCLTVFAHFWTKKYPHHVLTWTSLDTPHLAPHFRTYLFGLLQMTNF